MRTPEFAAPSQHSDFCASFKMHTVWRKVTNTPIVSTWRTHSSVSSSRFLFFGQLRLPILLFLKIWIPFTAIMWLLALVCGVYCEFVTFPLVSWVRCGTWLYRFLIFAPLLTLVCHLIGHADAFSSRRDIFENWLLWQINKLHGTIKAYWK